MVFIISGVGGIGGGYLLDKIDYRIVLAVVAAMMGLSLFYLQMVDVTSVFGHITLRAHVRRELRLPRSHARRRGQHYVRHPSHRKNLGHSAGGSGWGGGRRALRHGCHLRPARELLRCDLGTDRHQRPHRTAVLGHGSARRFSQEIKQRRTSGNGS